MKKIITVVGTRPNFIKAAPLQRALWKFPNQIQNLIVHTGQHYHKQMSADIMRDLHMPVPDYELNVGSGSHAEQTARIMEKFEALCIQIKPDMIVVVGDVNSTMACSIVAKKLGILLSHIEAGLRSFDMSMPEEINRKIVDSIADYAFVTEADAIRNLKNEGWNDDRIYFVGNTMIDSLFHAMPLLDFSNISLQPELSPGNYCVITLHRPGNVDSPEILKSMLETIDEISGMLKVIFPVHPRTLSKIKDQGYNIEANGNIIFTEPLGYIEFMTLVKNSRFVLTDSGGVQEETTVLNIPCITVRPNTERPVTCETGTNTLISSSRSAIIEEVKKAIISPGKSNTIPPLWDGHAAERIAEIISEILS